MRHFIPFILSVTILQGGLCMPSVSGIPAAFHAEESSGNAILQRVDNNYIAENRKVLATMIVKGPLDTRTLQARSWIQGTGRAFTEYLSPPKEQGTKMLKLGDELWIYSPATNRIMKMEGHMLNRSLMGSDFSYKDYMEDMRLVNIYDAHITGDERVGDRDCYALQLTAKSQETAYLSRKMWVDKEWYLPLREEHFAKGGKLLKSIFIHEVFETGGRWYPKIITVKDELKEGSGTELIVNAVEFNVQIPGHVFSRASLRK